MADNQSFNRYYIVIRKAWEKPTVRRFSEATATLFLIAFFLLAALKPTIETILTLNKKIADARITETAMTKKISDINAAQSIYAQISQDLPLINEYYPSNADAEVLINIINKNIEKSNLDRGRVNYDLASYSLVNATRSAAISSTTSDNAIHLNFGAKGAYNNIVNFLNNLVISKRLIFLDKISLSRTPTEADIDFSLNTKTYYEK